MAAGLNGIENQYEPPPPAEINLYKSTEEELRLLGVEKLPETLWDAVQITEKSDLVRNSLGEHVFKSFIRNKKLEWEKYRTQITDYEITRYLPLL